MELNSRRYGKNGILFDVFVNVYEKLQKRGKGLKQLYLAVEKKVKMYKTRIRWDEITENYRTLEKK